LIIPASEHGLRKKRALPDGPRFCDMGRRRIDILIPKVPFTTRDLKAQNPCVSAFVIHRNLQWWIAKGKVRRIGTEPHPGAGKACYLYRAYNQTPARNLTEQPVKAGAQEGG